MGTNYGTIEWQGVTIELTQQAYLEGDSYRAHGRDARGNTYLVEWTIVAAECDDESDACDWAHPRDVRLVEQADGGALRLPSPPPRYPREWRVSVRLADGTEPSVQVPDVDALGASLAPDGWHCIGAIYASAPGSTAAPSWRGWSVRLTFCPVAWVERYRLAAPPAVYAAAQIAGLPTRLDQVMVADHHGIQYYTPDGRPTARMCGPWEGRDQLPPEVIADLDQIATIDQTASIGGHMRGRPDTGRAQLLADDLNRADDATRRACVARIAAWVRSLPATVLEGGG